MKPLLSLALVIGLAGCGSQQAPAVKVDRAGIPNLTNPEFLKRGNSKTETIATLFMSLGPKNGRFMQSVYSTSEKTPNSIEVVMSPSFKQLSTDDQNFLKDTLALQWDTLTKQRKWSDQSSSINFRDSEQPK